MCCAPHRRAFFRHLNYQGLLRHWGALAFWVRNLLRATRACNFLFLISPDGSTPATLASLLTDPPEPQNIGKHGVSRLFYFFRAPASSFFWLFSDSLFSSLIFSDPSHLCFFICLIVGSLTSKFRRFLCVCVIVYVVKHVYVMMIMLMYHIRSYIYFFPWTCIYTCICHRTFFCLGPFPASWHSQNNAVCFPCFSCSRPTDELRLQDLQIAYIYANPNALGSKDLTTWLAVTSSPPRWNILKHIQCQKVSLIKCVSKGTVVFN